MVRRLFLAFALITALAAPLPSYGGPAQKKSTASKAQKKSETTPPKGATAQCKDGTYSTAQSRQGACSGHGGVATWLADTKEQSKANEKDSKDATKATKQAEKQSAKDVKESAPKGATAQCKDGTYSMAQSRQGACSSHGGIATWFGDKEETKAVDKGTKPEKKDETKATTKSASGAPANATAQCKDGTYSFSAHRSGTCSHHGGVKTWLNPPAK